MSDRFTLGPIISPTELDQAVIKISEEFPQRLFIIPGTEQSISNYSLWSITA